MKIYHIIGGPWENPYRNCFTFDVLGARDDEELEEFELHVVDLETAMKVKNYFTRTVVPLDDDIFRQLLDEEEDKRILYQ